MDKWESRNIASTKKYLTTIQKNIPTILTPIYLPSQSQHRFLIYGIGFNQLTKTKDNFQA